MIREKIENKLREYSIHIIVILCIIIFLLIPFSEKKSILLDIYIYISSSWHTLMQPPLNQETFSNAEHLYYLANIIVLPLMLGLTLVSVVLVRKSIVDNTRQRRLESVDLLIRSSVSEMKSILKSEVMRLPKPIEEFLNDSVTTHDNTWDINKVITQANAFTELADSIQNQSITKAIKRWLVSSDFSYDNFIATSVLANEFDILIDLILRRQAIQVDPDYNEVTLKRFSYLFIVLKWINEDLEDLEDKIDSVIYPHEDGLKEHVSTPRTVEQFEREFRKYENATCEDLLYDSKPKKSKLKVVPVPIYQFFSNR